MERQRRRGVAYVALLIGVTIAFTLAYRYGMATFEGRERSLLASLQVVVETFTTTGYGEDAPWQSAHMLGLMIAMQLTGVFLIFLTLPLFVVPWVERRLEVNPPSTVELEGHVVICGFSPRGEALIDELESQGVEYVVVEDDRERARDLHEAGKTVIHGDPGSTDALSRANVQVAEAVVLDQEDERNATVALSIREVNDDVRTVAFVDDRDLSRYLELAGTDEVLSPHDLVGMSLADKVTSVMTTQLGETVDIGADVEFVELPVQRGAELDGVTLAESGIRERTGANVIGAWLGGEFVPNVAPDRRLDRNTVLLVAGRESQLEAAMDLTLSPERSRTDEVIVAGYGQVGHAVDEVISGAHLRCTVVDVDEKPGVDVVGDATEESTLREAGIDDAAAIIIALGDDDSTVFATLVARAANPDVEIICRANETESVGKLYSAGADYVLAVSSVSGRMLAESILDEDVMTLDTQIDIVRTRAPGLNGRTLAEARVRERTDCTVIAVERDGTVRTDVGPDFRVERGDAVVVAGTDDDINRFYDVVGGGPDE
ncbi:MAG: TrkA family potassium uptake protein [Halanaeroarchaeum sp.]